MTEVIAAQATAEMNEAIAADPVLQAEQQAAFETRWGGVEDVRTLKSVQVHLPQGADEAAFATLERLRDLERRYAAPNLLGADYDLGVAKLDDEIRVIAGSGALVTAEHATNPYRKKTRTASLPTRISTSCLFLRMPKRYIPRCCSALSRSLPKERMN